MSLWTSIRNAITSPFEILTGQAGTKSAEKDYQISHQSAVDQMNFQERMSNTSYQRAVKDLQAAGLNPVLAALNGGASTPSGASYSSNFVGGTAQDIAGLNTLIGGAQGIANINNTNANTKLANANTTNTAIDTQLKTGQVQQIAQNTANSARDFQIKGEQLKQAQYETELKRVQTEKAVGKHAIRNNERIIGFGDVLDAFGLLD